MLNFGIEHLGFVPTIHGMEWVILIVVVVVLLFGAKKLPELARSLGRATGEYQKGKSEIEKELQSIKQLSSTPPSQSPSTSSEEELDKLIKIAKELGIETEGKTEAELKEEIAKAMMR
ncbi:twin-arginine translocase TatA/TatE family subunit [Candidatus Hecatella orcuttiae]|jgi:sec-independent protein translocase protein TatA|uniref:twin-arginine translocase TatA/TatE family subunit n=1 Tax=Candidatus Hecatella orcuttiae TaxID=1935119 RepID=UPI002867D8F5|nr:twin-arginine translocase TatA/TatE family subunit [Candidatus Hecatella orcuttiae]